MLIFDSYYLNNLTNEAKKNLRQRQHRNIHQTYLDPCQRFFNAIEPGSYIHPHRHSFDNKNELLIAIRGKMSLITFDDNGFLLDIVFFGTERSLDRVAVGVEVTALTWHTVIALEPGCVLLEVKSGPFDPVSSKELAPWAPVENSDGAKQYFSDLLKLLNV